MPSHKCDVFYVVMFLYTRVELATRLKFVSSTDVYVISFYKFHQGIMGHYPYSLIKKKKTLCTSFRDRTATHRDPPPPT